MDQKKEGPAHSLTGIQLQSGWRLVKKLEPGDGATGGNFGVGYKAQKDGATAFVKAIDFVGALESEDPLTELAKLTSEANFERATLEYCRDKRMSKVVRLLAHEYVVVGETTDPLKRVACLVMEFGKGDLRGELAGRDQPPCSWILEVLRDVALAIDQLHRAGIAHHDIKPSNVISIATRGIGAGQMAEMKLGDLGRVVRKTIAGPFDAHAWPGQAQYCPPERWYGFQPPAWPDARDAADAFMLGSLIFFLFTGSPIQPLLVSKLPEQFRPGKWAGDFDEELVNVLRDAQARCLADDLFDELPDDIREPLLQLTRQLTEPDPRMRGDTGARAGHGRPVGMDRIHQRLRSLALRSAVRDRVNIRSDSRSESR